MLTAVQSGRYANAAIWLDVNTLDVGDQFTFNVPVTGDVTVTLPAGGWSDLDDAQTDFALALAGEGITTSVVGAGTDTDGTLFFVADGAAVDQKTGNSITISTTGVDASEAVLSGSSF